jgi:putative transposase
MPRRTPHPIDLGQLPELIARQGLAGMADAMKILLDEAMKLERAQVLGAEPYQRTDARRGHANGYKPRTLDTRVGRIVLDVPQARGIPFYPASLERGLRSERALKLAVAEMYVQGVSTRKVAAVMRQLCGLDVTSDQVSHAAKLLDKELAAWRERPLGPVRYLQVDAMYERVRHGGGGVGVVPAAVLVALGVTPDGRRRVLGVSVSRSEAQTHWRQFFDDLQRRGLSGVELVVSDDHAGIRGAREAHFPGVPWQRCQFHLVRNAMDHCPRRAMRKGVAADLRTVFDAADHAAAVARLGEVARAYHPTAPDLADWLEAVVPEALTVFALPAALTPDDDATPGAKCDHRVRMRTTNLLERLNREVRRRTRVASVFPNEESLLRLVSAVLMETDQDWQADEQIYLPMEKP